MWSATTDPKRNLLEIRFAEHVGLSEVRLCSQHVQELLGTLQAGFWLLTDLSKLEEMELVCGPVIDQMMDLFSRAGIQKVVRVVPDPQKDIGLGIMALFHYGR